MSNEFAAVRKSKLSRSCSRPGPSLARPTGPEPDEAQKLLGAWYETGDDSGFESSEDIARLASELRSRWPDDYESDPPQDCPWADMPLTQSERLLAIDIRWGASDAAVAASGRG